MNSLLRFHPRMLSAVLMLAMIFLPASHIMACGCEAKQSLDARDWNDAEIILTGRIMNVQPGEGIATLTIHPLTVYRGLIPLKAKAPLSISYDTDGDHSLAHELAGISSGQEWIFFIEKGNAELSLSHTKLDAICALTRRTNPDDIAFLKKMIWGSEGDHEIRYKNGTLQASGTYLEGRPSGKWQYYDEEGHPLESGVYDNGKRSGTWDYYNFDHISREYRVFSKHYYEEGTRYAYEEFNFEGIIRIKHEFLPKGQLTSHYSDDGVLKRTSYRETETGITTIKEYSRKGKVVSETITRNGRIISKEKALP